MIFQAPTTRANSARFNWLRKHCNTIREIVGTWSVSDAIAADLQMSIGCGCSEQEANRVAAASLALCEQIGA